MSASGQSGAPQPQVERFPEDANTVEAALRYFTARAIQGLVAGWAWDGRHFLHTTAGARLQRHTLPPTLKGFPGVLWEGHVNNSVEFGMMDYAIFPANESGTVGELEGAKGQEEADVCAVEVHFTHAQYGRHMSVYVLAHARGRGLFPAIVEAVGLPVITVDDCRITAYMQKKGIAYITFGRDGSHGWPEYRLVEKFYGDKVTRRTGAHLMNHIDEGLFIMASRGATELSMRAFCLHPLVQSDADLASFVEQGLVDKVDKYVLLLAIEYRNIANAYLSKATSSTTFTLSPLKEVNEMLVADKVQNRKDFQRFHAASHPRAARLAVYFSQWLTRLGVAEEEYSRYTRDIVSASGLQQYCGS